VHFVQGGDGIVSSAFVPFRFRRSKGFNGFAFSAGVGIIEASETAHF
jgi:hypothetical protein